MGYVNDIYISKLSRVQQKLHTAVNRAGINTPAFQSILQDSKNELDEAMQEASAAQTMAAPVNEDYSLRPVSKYAGDYDEYIDLAASVYGLEPALIKAVIQTESSFRTEAVSSSGAQGLMQLLPSTASSLGVSDSFDAVENIMGGSAYLKKQLDRFGDIRLALAAYNTGPSKVEGLGIQNPDDISEYNKLSGDVKKYIGNVLSYYNTFSQQQ